MSSVIVCRLLHNVLFAIPLRILLSVLCSNLLVLLARCLQYAALVCWCQCCSIADRRSTSMRASDVVLLFVNTRKVITSASRILLCCSRCCNAVFLWTEESLVYPDMFVITEVGVCQLPPTVLHAFWILTVLTSGDICAVNVPLLSSRQHLSYDDCLEDEIIRTVLLSQLYPMICTLI